MISSSWFLFHEDVIKIKHFLEKKYPQALLINNLFLDNKINDKNVTVNSTQNIVQYYKLPYTVHISTDKLTKFCKVYCKNLSIKIALTPFTLVIYLI